jgi:tetratricopeptide (TPR) repeat protein
MAKRELMRKLQEIEDKIRLVRAEIELPVQRNKFVVLLRKVGKLVISNWVLFSFIVALGTIIYVKLAFGIDYFEEYRNKSLTKQLSEYYRELGDRMMASSKWKASEGLYKEALKINPNNVKATFGTLKAQVFQPLEGEKFFDPQVVDIKLGYLLTLFPNDRDIYLLMAFRFSDEEDIENAKLWSLKAIQKDPRWAQPYFNIGYIDMGSYDSTKKEWHVDIKESIDNFEKALELDPSTPYVDNNLGFLYLITGDFSKAIAHLEKSQRVAPNLLTAINLGDAYRYSGDFESARVWHENARTNINTPGIENENYASGEWTYDYMPLRPGDSETIKNYVKVYTFDEKKAFVHFALSFDYALLENFTDAETEFEEGLRLNTAQYGDFFRNKIFAIQSFLSLSTKTRLWFFMHSQRLLFK